jgi:tRNA pseudouridine13 synthase
VTQAAAWRATLESLPRAHGPPLAQALFKANLEDFLVEETLGFAPDGGRAHRLLKVEKAGLGTLDVARSLARRLRIPVADVGFAGLKDRRALARQWFTVPAAPDSEMLESYTEGAPEQGFRVLEAGAHSRKLRRGALSGNRFRIRLRALTPPIDSSVLTQRLGVLATVGAPNYFGPQRFGRDYGNLERIAAWLGGGRPAYGREPRAFLWSSARALIFNAVLAQRISDGSWARIVPGELVNLNGTRSFFSAPEVDAALERRLRVFDVHPTGPLAGGARRGFPGGGRDRLPGSDPAPGRSPSPEGEAGEREAAATEPFRSLIDALAAQGLEAARRPLRVVPKDLEGRIADDGMELSFALPAGSYATALLRECVELTGQPAEQEADDAA